MSNFKVIAFDIGIKNLAFCILQGSTVYCLENTNILAPVEHVKCVSCKASAKFVANSVHTCKRHVPKTFIVHTTNPTIPDLKILAKENGISLTKKTKGDLIAALSPKYAFPFIQQKQPKASKQSLADLHDALRAFITTFWDEFKTCTHILLENQPAFKNPHMKSVQVLLFAALRERYLQNDLNREFHLVHAKKKVQDAEAGDAGYSERKSKSEQRAAALFTENKLIASCDRTLVSWTGAKKKSDMADAVCMCYDFLQAHNSSVTNV